jgi:hypothetical protein
MAQMPITKTHVHIDLMERTNNYKICQWDVLDPSQIAALLARRPCCSPSGRADTFLISAGSVVRRLTRSRHSRRYGSIQPTGV